MSNWRERLSSSNRSFNALLAWDELMLLLFNRCSILSIFVLLSAKVSSSLSSIVVSKMLLLLSKSWVISENWLCVSPLNNDNLSLFCCSFSYKFSSREFCLSSIEISNCDNLSALLCSTVPMFWSSFSISWFAVENLFVTELMSNWREPLSSFISFLRAVFACDKLEPFSLTRSSIASILELLSAKVCSILSSIAVSKLLLLIANSWAISEICLCVSALNNDNLSPFCWSFS